MELRVTSDGSSGISTEEIVTRRKMLIQEERILFLLDIHPELYTAWDESKSRFDVLTDVLSSFCRRKIHSKLRHRFAIATFSNSIDFKIIQEFTVDLEKINGSLGALFTNISGDTTDVSDLTLDFSLLFARVAESLKFDNTSSHNFPLTRIIMIFGRSKQMPITSSDVLMLHQPFIFLDILYLHLKINEEGVLCQEIYDVLASLQSDSCVDKVSYIFETHHSAIRLHTYMAALLAHPVHRDNQFEILNKIEITPESLVAIRSIDNNLPAPATVPSPTTTTTNS